MTKPRATVHFLLRRLLRSNGLDSDVMSNDRQNLSKRNQRKRSRNSSALEPALNRIEAIISQADSNGERSHELSHSMTSREASGSQPTPVSSTAKAQTDNPETVAVEPLFQAIDGKLQAIIEATRSFERERMEVEMLRFQLDDAIASAESKLGSGQESQPAELVRSLETRVRELTQDNQRLESMLDNAREEYGSFIEFIETEAMPGYLRGASQGGDTGQGKEPEPSSREKELEAEVTRLQEQVEFYQEEIDDLRSLAASHEDVDSRVQIDRLRSQLLEARHEVVELRLQCNEINARLARFQGPSEKQRGESSSWEQRKEELLKQLEAETQSLTPCDPEKVVEIHRILEVTTQEIQHRDHEIADLRSLLEQQAIARDGMAVGIAGVAALIENDEIIIHERLRLKELQGQWEEKQRQAEVEMSMERAKLARERLEIQQLRPSDPNSSERIKESTGTKSTALKPGRWLARLGLRDE